MSSGQITGKRIVVVDTPDLFDTQLLPDELQRETATITSLSSHGPRVYLLVITLSEVGPSLGRMITFIQEAFGEKAVDYAMAIINCDSVDKNNSSLINHQVRKSLPEELRGRFHIMFRDNQSDQFQVILQKIEAMLEKSKSEIFPGNKPVVRPKPRKQLQATWTDKEDPQGRVRQTGEKVWEEGIGYEEDTQASSSYFNKCKLCSSYNSKKKKLFLSLTRE